MAKRKRVNQKQNDNASNPDENTEEVTMTTNANTAQNTTDNVDNVDPRTLKLGHAVEMNIERENEETITKRYASKSQAIVDLRVSYGLDTGEIAKALGIRYQFAYNVLKRNGKLEAPTNNPKQIAQTTSTVATSE